MKAVISNIALLSLSALVAAAQPHAHNHAHAHAHQKRKVVTQLDVMTIQAPDVVVYVDENGNTLSIIGGVAEPTPVVAGPANPAKNLVVSATPSGDSYVPTFGNVNEAIDHVTAVVTVTADSPEPTADYIPAAIAQPQPVAAPPPVAQPAPAAGPPRGWQAWQAPQPAPQRQQPQQGPVQVQAPAPAPASYYQPAAYAPAGPVIVPAQPAPAYASANVGGGGATAITWSPYSTKGGPCKQLDQAVSEFQRMAGFNVVRIYGTDCDQVNIAMKAGAATGKKIFAGIFNLNNVANEAQIIINAVRQNGNNWGMIDTVSIGNEDVGTKGRSVDDVLDAMNKGTPMLRNAGWSGPIVHVDTAGAYLDDNNIRNGICDSDTAGDYIAVNIHPFFNAQTSAENAGRFVANEVALVKSKCASINSRRHHRMAKRDARVRVTECGWPKAGGANGAAVPGIQQQRIAVASIQATVSDMILFSAFDAQWQDAGAFGVEPHWGILDG